MFSKFTGRNKNENISFHPYYPKVGLDFLTRYPMWPLTPFGPHTLESAYR